MGSLAEWYQRIPTPDDLTRVESLFANIQAQFPQLKLELKWNQPMFTDHGTFIMGFNPSKKHLAVAIEPQTMTRFIPQIDKAGYDHSQIIRFPWHKPLDEQLIHELIAYTIDQKKDATTFWQR